MKILVYISLIFIFCFSLRAENEYIEFLPPAKKVKVGEITIIFDEPQVVVSEDSGGISELGRYTYTSTMLHSIVNLSGHILIDEEYVGFFKDGDNIQYKPWLNEADRKLVPSLLKDALEKEEAVMIHKINDVTFIVNGIGGTSFFLTAPDVYICEMGTICFEIKKNRLVFRGKDYGLLESGMTVRWSNGWVVSKP
ncbi:MAG: hypothetical protein ABJQ29_13680 [Luteolibacter sp.]